MNASEIMSAPPVIIEPEASVRAAARKMLSANVSCLPVVDQDNRVVGILTHTDFGLHPKYRPLLYNVYSLLGTATTRPTLPRSQNGWAARRCGMSCIIPFPPWTLGLPLRRWWS